MSLNKLNYSLKKKKVRDDRNQNSQKNITEPRFSAISHSQGPGCNSKLPGIWKIQGNVILSQGKYSQQRKMSNDILELANKDFKAAVITMLMEIKEKKDMF